MRKRLVIAMLVLTTLLTACGNIQKDKVSVEIEISEEMETTDVVMPLYPLESAEDALADGGYAVSFKADDLVKSDGGYSLIVEVYEYDRYEKESIENLMIGSKIKCCNEIIVIEDVKKTETGLIEINGGMENSGIELREEDGLYRTIAMNDYPVYYSVGRVTIPLSDEITFEDHAEIDNEPDGIFYYTEDLPTVIGNSNALFNCNNTVITVRQEQIVQIIRYWVP